MAHQLPIAGVVEAVIVTVRTAVTSFGVEARLIGIMSRTFGEAACLLPMRCWRTERKSPRWDLAGDELGFPASVLSHFNGRAMRAAYYRSRWRPQGRVPSGRRFANCK